MNRLFKKVIKKAATWDQRPFCTAVVAAGGRSERMAGRDKLMAPLGGVPVLARTLQELQASPYIHEIVVVTREESIVPTADLCAQFQITKATKILCGGEERIDSVLAGVQEASPEAEFIAIHDGARPLVTQEVIRDVFHLAYQHHAAAPAVPVNDTVKVVKDAFVVQTPDRASLRAVQTPQVFRADLIKAALYNARDKGMAVTDDCAAVEAIGVKPAVSRGSEENIKITRPMDLVLAEAILEARRGI